MCAVYSPDGVDGDQVGQLAVITRSNFTLFKEAVTRCVYSDKDIKVAFAGVCLLFAVCILLIFCVFAIHLVVT